MNTWTPEEARAFSETYSLVLSAGEPDGSGGPGVEVGMVAVDGRLYVRAYSGVRSHWYQAAREHGRGRIRVGDVVHDVRFHTGEAEPSPAIDHAFRDKYGQVAAFLVDTAGAREATLRIAPAR